MDRFDSLRARFGGSDRALVVVSTFTALESDDTQVTVDAIEQEIRHRGGHILRRHITEVLRFLERQGMGQFVVGRRGHRSRFVSSESLCELAKEALCCTSPEGESREADTTGELEVVLHKFVLRPGFEISLELPTDFSKREAERLIAFIRLLPFGFDSNSEGAD
ncbi:MAG: hypothetical protein RJP95_02020 [Pirellulales bacterium]